MSKPYVAPKFTLTAKRTAVIPFSGTVLAGTILSIITTSISFKFRITLIEMVFSHGAGNLVEHAWFIDRNVSTSVTGFPSGTNLFAAESAATLFTGDGVIRRIPMNYIVDEEGMHIKLYTNNPLAVDYVVNASVVIQEL
jgi:hypothetical protein